MEQLWDHIKLFGSVKYLSQQSLSVLCRRYGVILSAISPPSGEMHKSSFLLKLAFNAENSPHTVSHPIQPLWTRPQWETRCDFKTSQFKEKELLNVFSRFSGTFKANHFHRIVKQCVESTLANKHSHSVIEQDTKSFTALGLLLWHFTVTCTDGLR